MAVRPVAPIPWRLTCTLAPSSPPPVVASSSSASRAAVLRRTSPRRWASPARPPLSGGSAGWPRARPACKIARAGRVAPPRAAGPARAPHRAAATPPQARPRTHRLAARHGHLHRLPRAPPARPQPPRLVGTARRRGQPRGLVPDVRDVAADPDVDRVDRQAARARGRAHSPLPAALHPAEVRDGVRVRRGRCVLAKLREADFVIELAPATWRAMLDDIRANGHATGDYTLNSRDLLGDGYRADKFFRCNPSLRRFFDNAARLDGCSWGRRRRRADRARSPLAAAASVAHSQGSDRYGAA